MTSEKDEHRWLHLVLGTVGVFVLVNQFFGAGTLEGLFRVSWGGWGVVLLTLSLLGGLFFALRGLWKACWDMEPPAQQN